MARLSSVSVSLKIPYIGGVEGTWAPDEREREAAWQMMLWFFPMSMGLHWTRALSARPLAESSPRQVYPTSVFTTCAIPTLH